MPTICKQCKTELGLDDWFCPHCGQKRGYCPDCGAEMNNKGCKNCEVIRRAPCEDCGLMIDATKETCPECGFTPAEEKKELADHRMKRGGIFLGVGVAIFVIISAIIPGPSEIGILVGLLFSGVPLLGGGIVILSGISKSSNAGGDPAASISKGVSQNKSKAWKEKERQESVATAEAVASGLEAVGEYAQKKQKDEKVKELAEKKQLAEAEAQQAKQKKRKLKESPSLPSKCPRCGADWSGGFLSSPNVDQYSNGRKASCTECPHRELLFRE